jgi:hypothetical protein
MKVTEEQGRTLASSLWDSACQAGFSGKKEESRILFQFATLAIANPDACAYHAARYLKDGTLPEFFNKEVE